MPDEPLLREEAEPRVVSGKDSLLGCRRPTARHDELRQPRVDVIKRCRARRLLGEVEQGVDEGRVGPRRQSLEARQCDRRCLRDCGIRQCVPAVDESGAVQKRGRSGRSKRVAGCVRDDARRNKAHVRVWAKGKVADESYRLSVKPLTRHKARERRRTSSTHRRRRKQGARRHRIALRLGRLICRLVLRSSVHSNSPARAA